MKKLLIFILLTLMVPASAMAMKAKDQGGMKMDKASMANSEMSGVMMLQDEVVDGVKGAAHLMDAKDGKGQMLMVMFTDEKTGAMLSEGRCAVKIESPDEKPGKAQRMMMRDGMFSTDIDFTKKGMHHLQVGTKLVDGKKRVFNFRYENK